MSTGKEGSEFGSSSSQDPADGSFEGILRYMAEVDGKGIFSSDIDVRNDLVEQAERQAIESGTARVVPVSAEVIRDIEKRGQEARLTLASLDSEVRRQQWVDERRQEGKKRLNRLAAMSTLALASAVVMFGSAKFLDDSQPAKQDTPITATEYVVQPGDSVESIAHRTYPEKDDLTNVRTWIEKVNNISPENLVPGQRLIVRPAKS